MRKFLLILLPLLFLSCDTTIEAKNNYVIIYPNLPTRQKIVYYTYVDYGVTKLGDEFTCNWDYIPVSDVSDNVKILFKPEDTFELLEIDTSKKMLKVKSKKKGTSNIIIQTDNNHSGSTIDIEVY